MSNPTSLSDVWTHFEAWVHSWFPGFKTRATTALGAIGSFAALAYQYVQGLPETKWFNKEVLMGTSAALFTLSFWFSNMGTRVQDYETPVAPAPVVTPIETPVV